MLSKVLAVCFAT